MIRFLVSLMGILGDHPATDPGAQTWPHRVHWMTVLPVPRRKRHNPYPGTSSFGDGTLSRPAHREDVPTPLIDWQNVFLRRYARIRSPVYAADRVLSDGQF
jgi:hypothetical protein